MEFECPCSQPGYCDEYGIILHGRLFDICRGFDDSGNEVLTAEKREVYRQRWLADAKKNPKPPPPTEGGAGTELKSILSWFGINATGSCQCAYRARVMNEKGTHWCADNIGTILGWLKEEADKRHIPFSRKLAKMLVRRAIKRARKKGAP